MNKIICPYCGSPAIFRYRRDSDWGGGCDYDAVNDPDAYVNYSSRGIPDVSLYHCGSCDHFFEPSAPYPTVDVVPVAELESAIANLEKHISWLTQNYKQSCLATVDRIQKASCREMGTTIPCQFPELVKKYGEIEKFDEQAKTLRHILDQRKVAIPTIYTTTEEEAE